MKKLQRQVLQETAGAWSGSQVVGFEISSERSSDISPEDVRRPKGEAGMSTSQGDKRKDPLVWSSMFSFTCKSCGLGCPSLIHPLSRGARRVYTGDQGRPSSRSLLTSTEWHLPAASVGCGQGCLRPCEAVGKIRTRTTLVLDLIEFCFCMTRPSEMRSLTCSYPFLSVRYRHHPKGRSSFASHRTPAA